MKLLRLILSATLVLLVYSNSPGLLQAFPQSQSAATFRAGIDLVVLQVSVTDKSRQPIADLRPDEFTVFEDGRPQSLTDFSRDRKPLALSLLIDTSASIKPTLSQVQAAAVQFVKRLRPDDVAQVVTFNDHVTVPQPFTSNYSDLEAAIRGTHAAGNTSLYNALYIALSELRALPSATPNQRQNAIVLLSDGKDTSSVMDLEPVVNLAQRSGVAIYAIDFDPRADKSGVPLNDGQLALRRLALTTGGQSLFADAANTLAGVYSKIADDFASQYTLAYTPTNSMRDGRWRTVSVHVNRPNCTTRTRPGYFAGS